MNQKNPLTQNELVEWLVSYRHILFDAMHCLDTLKVLDKDNDGEQVIARLGFVHMMWNLYQHVMINSLDKLCYDGSDNHLTIGKLGSAIYILKDRSWLTERLAAAKPRTLRWSSWDQVERFLAHVKQIRTDYRTLIDTIHGYRNNVTSHTYASFGGKRLPRPILANIEMKEAQELIDQLQICFLEVSGGIFGDTRFPVTRAVTLQQLIERVRVTAE